MFGTDSERILLSFRPTLQRNFRYKKCNSGFVRMSLEDAQKTRKDILKRNLTLCIVFAMYIAPEVLE